MSFLVTEAMAQEPAPAVTEPDTTAPQTAPLDQDLDASAPDATHTEIGHEEGAPAGPFPPFDPSTYALQLVWLAISFGLLYLLMKRVLAPRVGAIIDDRAARIGGDVAQAERLRQQSEAAIAAYEKALAEARANRSASPARRPRPPRPRSRPSAPASKRSSTAGSPPPRPASTRSRAARSPRSARSPRRPRPRSSRPCRARPRRRTKCPAPSPPR